MKNVKKLVFASLLVAGLSFTSCKKEAETQETDGMETTDTIMTTEPDTTAVQPAPVNDSNAAGTTSGTMEQVP